MNPYATLAAEHCAWARSARLRAHDVCRSLGCVGNSWAAARSAVETAARLADRELDHARYDVEGEAASAAPGLATGRSMKKTTIAYVASQRPSGAHPGGV